VLVLVLVIVIVLARWGDAPPVLTCAHQKIEDEDEDEHDWGKERRSPLVG
jgi:hypothetical protein